MRIVDASGGRLHKLGAHQVAHEVGLERAGVAALYNNIDPQCLVTKLPARVLTDAGRARIAGIWP
jgi:hypothetical protein